MRTHFRVVAIAAFAQLGCSAIGAAQNASLDAPLVSRAPTTRSELVRGKDGAANCASDLHRSIETVQRCLNDMMGDNRQRMGRAYEAFETGLFFEAWALIDDRLSAENGTNVLGDPAVLRNAEKQYWQTYQGAKRAVGLSDAQVMDALQVSGAVQRMFGESLARYGD